MYVTRTDRQRARPTTTFLILQNFIISLSENFCNSAITGSVIFDPRNPLELFVSQVMPTYAHWGSSRHSPTLCLIRGTGVRDLLDRKKDIKGKNGSEGERSGGEVPYRYFFFNSSPELRDTDTTHNKHLSCSSLLTSSINQSINETLWRLDTAAFSVSRRFTSMAKYSSVIST